MQEKCHNFGISLIYFDENLFSWRYELHCCGAVFFSKLLWNDQLCGIFLGKSLTSYVFGLNSVSNYFAMASKRNNMPGLVFMWTQVHMKFTSSTQVHKFTCSVFFSFYVDGGISEMRFISNKMKQNTILFNVPFERLAHSPSTSMLSVWPKKIKQN